MKRDLHIGGQAVIEGVMIKSEDNYVVTIRKKNKIVTKKEKLRTRDSKIVKLPFIRGVVNLYDMLVIGIKSLIWSADQQEEKKEEKISKKEIIITISVSFIFAILFFVALPYFLTGLLNIQEETRPLLFNLVDGVIRIGLFLGYIIIISFMKDIRRLFQYHGAEHKAVNCFEDKKPLTLANVKNYSTLHTRCGSSFIMIVLVISILLFSVLPSFVMTLMPTFLEISFWYRKTILFFLRISMIPIIAGIAYEALKFSDRYKKIFFIGLVFKPGLWLQAITTREPDKKQIEVGIGAVKELLKLEGKKGKY